MTYPKIIEVHKKLNPNRFNKPNFITPGQELQDDKIVSHITAKKYVLNVCIVCRDRLTLTAKTINSILQSSSVFSEINISCFDNYSELVPERMEFFYNLLKNEKIKYYSYEKAYSTANCFPKVVCFNRWIDIMNLKYNIEDIDSKKEFYLLIDNDMILMPEWDTYFLSLFEMENSDRFLKDIHFVCPYPSGIVSKNIDSNNIPQSPQFRKFDLKNNYNSDKFKFITSNGGGASGFWFMNHKMLNSVKWDYGDIIEVKGRFKRQDKNTWKIIKRKNGNYMHYVGTIEQQSKLPLIIHLGGGITDGSICTKAHNNKYCKDASKKLSEEEKEEFNNLSPMQIYEKYKFDSRGKW